MRNLDVSLKLSSVAIGTKLNIKYVYSQNQPITNFEGYFVSCEEYKVPPSKIRRIRVKLKDINNGYEFYLYGVFIKKISVQKGEFQ